jgi:uncharacterized repeat protein (TIGR03803 family)
MRLTVFVIFLVLVLAALAQAQTFTVLHSFTGSPDGGFPMTGVIQDPAGNLYGTTTYGGGQNCFPFGCGSVYEVTTAGRETVLHSFSGPDGDWPYGPVTRDKAGNIYGTAGEGGSPNCAGGCGLVFKIDTAGNETMLYNFTGGSDGCYPAQGLIRDEAGTLYGTTSGCGSSHAGTIFKVDRAGNFTLLHSFTGGSSDGAFPDYGHLTMDQSGNLYGVTVDGGASTACGPYGCGVLYRLSENGKFTLLHSFAGGTTDGCNPWGSVVRDKAGTLYGTTYYCGSSNNGTIWRVCKKGKETILHNFAGGASDGCYPPAGVIRDSKGNLYGVAVECGANGYGALYELGVGGMFTLLHSFAGRDGAQPAGEVWQTAKGELFGTADLGGTRNCSGDACGTVWSYVP